MFPLSSAARSKIRKTLFRVLVAKAIMKPQRLAVIAAGLLIGGIALSAQTPDRSKPPSPGTPPALSLPSIQKRTLSNGLPVWIVEMHEVPVAQGNLVVL